MVLDQFTGRGARSVHRKGRSGADSLHDVVDGAQRDGRATLFAYEADVRHVGGAVAAIGWFTAFTALTAGGVVTGPNSGLGIALLALSTAIPAVLGGMAVCARPTARESATTGTS